MLTDIAIRTAKTDRRRLKLSDAGGLQLMVYPTGRKTWLYAYRLDGKAARGRARPVSGHVPEGRSGGFCPKLASFARPVAIRWREARSAAAAVIGFICRPSPTN